MYFCVNCGNMYYLKLVDDKSNNLIYYCRNCGHEDDILTSDNVCVSHTQINNKEQQYVHIVNEFTKYDPTLPRINTIDCPNSKCESNLSHEALSKNGDKAPVDKEIIYIRYDDINMKYVYVCAICNTTWKNDK